MFSKRGIVGDEPLFYGKIEGMAEKPRSKAARFEWCEASRQNLASQRVRQDMFCEDGIHQF